MAVNSNLLSRTDPYVHSNILHFTYFVTDTLKNDEAYKAEIDKLKSQLNQWIQQLQAYEKELYDFCDVSDYQALNRKLFIETKNNYQKVAIRVLQDPNFLRALVPKIDEKIGKKIATVLGNNADQFMNKMFSESDLTYTVSEFSDKFAEWFRNELLSVSNETSSGRKIATIEQLQQLVSKDISHDIANKKWVEVSRQTKNGGLNQLARNLVQSQGFEDVFISESEFLNLFKKFFPQAQNAEDITIVESDKQIYDDKVEDVGRQVFNYLNQSGGLPAALLNIIGHTGEQLVSFIFHESEPSIGVVVNQVGLLNEKQLAEQFSKLSSNFNTLRIHDVNKYSQSDEVLTIINKKGTRVFRIQSKNSLLTQLEKTQEGYKENVRPQIVKLIDGKTTSLQNLFDFLITQASITDYDASVMAYYLANMVWFANRKSVGPGMSNSPNRRTRAWGKTGGLGGAQRLVNQTLSKGIAAFIGLTANESISNSISQLDLGASNIFYFLSSSVLFPVSEVLKQLVQQIENQSDELSHLHTKINTSGVTLGLTAQEFYYEKKLAVGGKFEGLIYGPEITQVGRLMGQKIIDQISVNVNMNFSIAKILNSAYNFANKGS